MSRAAWAAVAARAPGEAPPPSRAGWPKSACAPGAGHYGSVTAGKSTNTPTSACWRSRTAKWTARWARRSTLRSRTRFLRFRSTGRGRLDKLAAVRRRPEDPRLEHLSRVLELAGEDAALLRLTLAAAVDPAIARVFGYLLDMTEAADPTPALARALFELPPGPAPAPDCALVRWLLAEPVHDGRRPQRQRAGAWIRFCPERSPAPTGRPARPASRSDRRTGPCCTSGRSRRPHVRVRAGRRKRRGADRDRADRPARSGGAALAAQAVAPFGWPLLAVDVGALSSAGEFAEAATREARRVRLEGSVMSWERPELAAPGLWACVPSATISFILARAQGLQRCGRMLSAVRFGVLPSAAPASRPLVLAVDRAPAACR